MFCTVCEFLTPNAETVGGDNIPNKNCVLAGFAETYSRQKNTQGVRFFEKNAKNVKITPIEFVSTIKNVL